MQLLFTYYRHTAAGDLYRVRLNAWASDQFNIWPKVVVLTAIAAGEVINTLFSARLIEFSNGDDDYEDIQ